MAAAIKAEGPKLVKKMKGVICYNITDSGSGAGAWTVDLKNGSGSISEGKKKADMTLTVSDDNMIKLVEGKLNPQQAFMGGKIKIKGNMGLAMKMDAINKVLMKYKDAAGADAPAGGDSAPASGIAAVFKSMEAQLASQGKAMVKKVKGVICFNVTGAGKWTVDLKNGNGSIEKDSSKKADMTLTVSEANFMDMISGKLNGQQAFMSGKIKIKGNMGLAMKLTQ